MSSVLSMYDSGPIVAVILSQLQADAMLAARGKLHGSGTAGVVSLLHYNGEDSYFEIARFKGSATGC
jgi:hypothetical protein